MEEVTYKEFINNILETRGRFVCGEEYHERHHIIPKCMGGTNDKENLIDLFAREHFEAHRLLALENPEHLGLMYAWHMMSTTYGNDNQERYKVTPEEYEEAKIKLSNMLKDVMHGDNHPMWGKHHSEESKEKMRNARIGKYCGENSSQYGKSLSDDTREKISIATKKRFTNKDNHPSYGTHLTEERKQNLSEKAKERLKDSHNHPMYGKKRSNEEKLKISNTLKERFKDPTKNPNYGKGRSIVQLTLNNELIASYISSIDAKKKTGISDANIRRVCQHIAQTAGGYKWMYESEYLELNKTSEGDINEENINCQT